MNKFKKILLGALSILTLGLVAVTGAKVNAANPTYSNNYKTATFNSSGYDGLMIVSYDSVKNDNDISPCSGFPTLLNKQVLFIPVPNGSTGSITTLSSRTNNDRQLYLFDSTRNVTSSSVKMNGTNANADNTTNFTSSNLISIDDATYIALGKNDNKDNKITNYVINLTVGTYPSETSKIFTLNYDANGGTGKMDAATNAEALVATSSNFTVLDNSFSRQGYNFVGWSTSSTATVAEYKAGETFEATSETSTLYAVWEQDTSDVNYTLNFDANGGTQGTISSIVSDDLPYTTTSYTFTILADATPSRDKYDFLGWATTSSATEAEYQPNDTYTATSISTTLYAVWEKQTYIISNEMTIEFNTLNIDEVVISNGQLYSNSALKFGSSTKVEFTTSKDFILTLKTDKDKYSYGIKVDNNNLSFDSTNYEAKIFVKAGKHTIERISSEIRLYSINFKNPLSDNTTASVFAEKNGEGTKLRFVGTITGITDLASVEKIELILGKNGTLASNPINLTKCYTSVEGSSQTCEAADGTYYTIFRLSGIKSLPGGTKISKQLKVTFTDGSTTSCEPSEITL